MVGGYDQSDELMQYMNAKREGTNGHDQAAASNAATAMGLGLPAVVYYYLFIFISIQVHMLALYTAQRLREAWRASLAPSTRGGRSYADKHK